MDLILGNLTYILIASSYLVRDMLQLRVLAVTASCCSILFMILRGNYLVVSWNVFFIVVNVAQLARLVYERRPIVLEPEQQRVYEKNFLALSKADFLRVHGLAEEVTMEDGAHLVEEGEMLRRLYLVLEGKARVVVKGEEVAQVKPGLFVGEMSFLTEAPATAEVIATGEIRVLAWDKAGLRAYLATRDQLRNAIQGILGLDLTKKIRRSVGLATTAGNIAIEDLTSA